jgi:hypothetical protein
MQIIESQARALVASWQVAVGSSGVTIARLHNRKLQCSIGPGRVDAHPDAQTPSAWIIPWWCPVACTRLPAA